MKVVVLGGAGDMGSRAVEDLAMTGGVERVTIADSNLDAAQSLIARLEGAPARVDCLRIDANHHSEVVEAVRGYDVAASALGPFHRFEVKLARAALDAGVDYASICDEWDAAEAVFEALDSRARNEGRTILTGLGASPGATNLTFAYLASKMDKVERADIYCFQPLDAGGGPAVAKHMLHIMSGSTKVWRKGKLVDLPALSEERSVEFPRFGRLQVWNMGHAEPMTIPKFFPDINDVNFFMGFGPGSLALVIPARLGIFGTPERIDLATGVLSWIDWATRKDEPGHGAIRIDLSGWKDGRPAQSMACGVGEMRNATGIALSLGAQMLARGELTKSGGVFSPEGCIDPQKAIPAFAAKGLVIFTDIGMTRRLS